MSIRNSAIAGLFLGIVVLTSIGFAAANPLDETQSATNSNDEVTDEQGNVPENPFPNRAKAPEDMLDGGTAWLNTGGDINLKDLRGKIVLFDFWTYCCINCMHILPDLKYLEQKYPNELVVIGVHSAKFDNEQDSEAIRQAIVRYEIEHPVVNDSNRIIWRKFGTRAWPTLALIDPEGYYLGSQSGEGHRELFDAIIARLVEYHSAKGTLDRSPIRFDLERDRVPPGPLKYPGKVHADEAGNRLFVSDSNHNRIVISTLDGKLVDVIGNGAMGFKDGSYSEAMFDHPQGMALVGETLYVADTENHAIRVVDLTAKTVSTLVGTGEQSRARISRGHLNTAGLNSPWALEHVNGVLYIAMAGPHQMWSHELGTNVIGVYAGTGREDIINGPLAESALAQPSGVVSDGESFMYVVDSEGSAVRKIGIGENAEVTTIAGTSELPRGQSLFAFGDKDGIGADARLQHPLGVAYVDDALYIADSYNHKIKHINLDTNEVTTWLGDGTAGNRLEPARFSEPAGLAIAGETLFIADTNNHRICTANLKTNQFEVFEIAGLEPPTPIPTEELEYLTENSEVMTVATQTVQSDGTLQFEIKLNLPTGFKINPLAPLNYRLQANADQQVIAPEHLSKRQKATAENDRVAIAIPMASQSGTATFDLTLTFNYCRDGVGGLCKMDTARWRIPVSVAADGSSEPITLETPIIE